MSSTHQYTLNDLRELGDRIDAAIAVVRSRYILHVLKSGLPPDEVRISIGSKSGNIVSFEEYVRGLEVR